MVDVIFDVVGNILLGLLPENQVGRWIAGTVLAIGVAGAAAVIALAMTGRI